MSKLERKDLLEKAIRTDEDELFDQLIADSPKRVQRIKITYRYVGHAEPVLQNDTEVEVE